MKSFLMPKGGTPLYLSTAAVIAALYVVFTLPFAQFAYGPLQFRLSEIFVVLPLFTSSAIPGLSAGCLIANLFNPNSLGVIDVFFGTLATFLAACFTRIISGGERRERSLKRGAAALVPPVLFNALIVGSYLPFLLTEGPVTFPLVLVSMSQLACSEAVLVYALGFPFFLFIRKSNLEKTIFRNV